MKKKRIGILGGAMLLAASLVTPASLANAVQTTTPQPVEQANSKATKPEHKKANSRVVKTVGGLDLVHEFTRYVNTPYMYAIQHGAKKHGSKTNYKRLSHNFKVKRRAK